MFCRRFNDFRIFEVLGGEKPRRINGIQEEPYPFTGGTIPVYGGPPTRLQEESYPFTGESSCEHIRLQEIIQPIDIK